jgi:hypothetical protein
VKIRDRGRRRACIVLACVTIFWGSLLVAEATNFRSIVAGTAVIAVVAAWFLACARRAVVVSDSGVSLVYAFFRRRYSWEEVAKFDLGPARTLMGEVTNGPRLVLMNERAFPAPGLDRFGLVHSPPRQELIEKLEEQRVKYQFPGMG